MVKAWARQLVLLVLLLVVFFASGCGRGAEADRLPAEASTPAVVVSDAPPDRSTGPVVTPLPETQTSQSGSAPTATPHTPAPEPDVVAETDVNAPSPALGSRVYVVRPGDTLWQIAASHHVSVDDLMAANELASDHIWVGQELTIPGEDWEPAPGPTPDPTSEDHTPTPAPVAQLSSLPVQTLLGSVSHEYQGWNNCGPATVAMALSFFGEQLTQYDLAPKLKGSDEDKHVNARDIVPYLHQLGYGARMRINGDAETLQRLLANDVPVIVQQWLERPGEELTGHWRLVRGFDREADSFIVNDSYLGPNLPFSYNDFDRQWRAFNRLYIPVYWPEQEPLVRSIIGEDWDDDVMYRRSLVVAEEEIQRVGDLYAWWNLGDSHLGLGQAGEAAAAFDRALSFELPLRIMWYRFGPLEAYNEAGRYERALHLTTSLLEKVPMLEEAHYFQGRAYEGLGQHVQATAAYRLALQYNPRFTWPQEGLRRLEADAQG